MWKFASTVKYRITIKEDFQDLPLLRKNDVPLMTVFAKTFKNSNLETLNHVRKHLKAYSLADIATIDGKYISQIGNMAKNPRNNKKYDLFMATRCKNKFSKSILQQP